MLLSDHARRRMARRGVTDADVEAVVARPWRSREARYGGRRVLSASRLIGSAARWVHVVVAPDGVVVTVFAHGARVEREDEE